MEPPAAGAGAGALAAGLGGEGGAGAGWTGLVSAGLDWAGVEAGAAGAELDAAGAEVAGGVEAAGVEDDEPPSQPVSARSVAAAKPKLNRVSVERGLSSSVAAIASSFRSGAPGVWALVPGAWVGPNKAQQLRKIQGFGRETAEAYGRWALHAW